MFSVVQIGVLADSVPKGYELASWKVNGVVVPLDADGLVEVSSDASAWLLDDTSGVFASGVFQNDKVLRIRMMQTAIPEIDWTVEAVFTESAVITPFFAPTVTVANSESTYGSIATGSPSFESNAADGSFSTWTLSTIPASGYELKYIQVGDETSTRVESPDGKTVTWNVYANADYTAHFGLIPLSLTLDALTPLVSQNSSAAMIYAGQRVYLKLDYTLSAASTELLTVKVYAGEDTAGTPIGSFSASSVSFRPTSYSSAGTHTLDGQLIIESMPQVSQITVTAQLGTGEVIASKAFSIDVTAAGEKELTYLTTPSGLASQYPTEGTLDKGPDVFDACAFTDGDTGALSVYLAASGGILKYDPDSFTDFEYMDGMDLSYRTRQYNYAFAIGGKTENELTALVKEFSGSTTYFYIYTCTDGVWSKVETSELTSSQDGAYGLVLGRDNIWVENHHWNGSGWTENEVSFTSFLRPNGKTAYAGSSDGLYVYGDTGWTKVSGTSGRIVLCGGAVTSIGTVLTVSSNINATGATRSSGYMGSGSTQQKLVIQNGSVISTTDIDVGNVLPDGMACTVYVDHSGELVLLAPGRDYQTITGSYLYRQSGGAWQYQNVAAFNNSSDLRNINAGKAFGSDYGHVNKSRPDAVHFALTLLDSLTLYLGEGGSIYASYGNTTITLDPNGGSFANAEDATITGLAGSVISAPTSPVLEGSSFGGWYTDAELTQRYTFATMPYSNITLYAGWSDDLGPTRQEAQAALDTEYAKYDPDDYTAEGKAALATAYETGTSGIATGSSYDAINAALSTAKAAFAAIELSPTITVAVTIEKLTVNGELIMEPTLVEVERNALASVAIAKALDELYPDYVAVNGHEGPYIYRGTLTSSFYLASIYDPSYGPDETKNLKQFEPGFLSEFDGGDQSGWMYCVNRHFPGVGASGWVLNNKDVMRWQYTRSGYGSDIGQDNSAFGGGSGIAVADKDALIWRIAEINRDEKTAFFAEKEGNEAAYNAAMQVLKALGASQDQVDAAYESIGGVIDPAVRLARAQAAALKALSNYDTDAMKNQFREAEQALLTQHIEEGTAAIMGATVWTEVEDIKEEYLAKIYELKLSRIYAAEEAALTLNVSTVSPTTRERLLAQIPFRQFGNNYYLHLLGIARDSLGADEETISAYYTSAEAYVQANADEVGRLHGAKPTENAKLILALTAIGKDPRNIGGKNLLAPLADMDYVAQQGLSGYVYTLLALDSLAYEIPEAAAGANQTTREGLIQAILDAQLAGGGWALAGTNADAAATAQAIQALAPYCADNAAVRTAVNNGITVLTSLEQETGDFLNGEYGSSESTAEVIIALCALDIDPATDSRFLKGDGANTRSPLNGLFLYYTAAAQEQNSFFAYLPAHVGIYSPTSARASALAYSALSAYTRMKNGQSSLYDMTAPVDPAEQLALAKEAAIESLETYVSADDYREAEQAQLAAIITSGTTAINAAETQEAVNTALAEAKAQIDELKTAAAYEAEENANYAAFNAAYAATQDYLLANVPTPVVDSVFGDWTVLGLARSGAEVPEGYYEGYYQRVKTFVAQNMDSDGRLHSSYSTVNARLIAVLTAIGRDPRDVGGKNLLTGLTELEFLKGQGINGPIWALIAFDSANYDIPTNTGNGTQVTRDGLVQLILNSQLPDGGWNLNYLGTGDYTSIVSDVDMTGMAVTALAPYYSTNTAVKTAVDRAVAFLSSKQLTNGDYASYSGELNAESTAWVIVALSALERNVHTELDFIKGLGTETKSALDGLLKYKLADGGFLHTITGTAADANPDQMATEQSYYAMTAFARMRGEQTALFDMSDVTLISDTQQARIDAAAEVDRQIAAIGEVSLNSKAVIETARAAYDALSAEAKTLVTKLQVLTDAEAAYKELADAANQESIDMAAAAGVDELIDALGTVTLESEDDIKAARAGYESLTETQKALVTKLDALTAAEAELAKLKDGATTLAEVRFHLLGGSAEGLQDGEIVTYTKSKTGEALPTATREGHTFNGWYDAESAGTKYETVSADLPDDLYARWTANSSGGSGSGSGDGNKDKIHVTMRLIGAEQASQMVDLGANTYLPNYVTWIPTTSFELNKDATVYDLFILAMNEAGLRSEGASNNYVKTIYAPEGYALSEFSNGNRSGWMYLVNGSHPGLGLQYWTLNDGDVVVWHYINDYSYECADWYSGDSQWPSLGDGTYYNRWFMAPDYAGGAGGGQAAKAIGSSGGSGSGSTVTEDGVTITETTIEGDDGSKAVIVTETKSETVENEDGSVTETNIEKVTETVTDADGNVTKTETVAENETTTSTVENKDGSTTETAETKETVTATKTAEDGSTAMTETTTETKVETTTTENEDGSTTTSIVTETKETTTTTFTDADGQETSAVIETTETRTVETTVDAEGKVSGGGKVSSTATVTDEDGNVLSTAVTEGTVTVETDDKGTVSEVTTAKTTTTAADGTKTEAITVTTDSVAADGCTGKTVEDENGNTLSAEATVSEEALKKALETGEPISLPVNVNPVEDGESAPLVTVYLPFTEDEDKVELEIEVKLEGPGIVALIRQPSGALSIDPKCRAGSVIVSVSGSCDIVIVDNTKYFSDVEDGSWFKDSVTYVTAREIFNGYGDGIFAPGDKMNRAMAAQIIYNLEKGKPVSGNKFSDVAADAWYAPAVGWAAKNGIVNGADGAYRPLEDITRQDLVVILYRYAKMAKYNQSIDREVILNSYADGADVASYAADAMRWAITQGLITGYEDGSLRPKNTATRAEVAAMIQRLIQNVVR